MSGTDARIGTTLIQHAPLLVALVDRERKILHTSARFEEIFGRGETCRDVCRARTHRCESCPLQALFDGEEQVGLQRRLWTRDGRAAICDITAVAFEQVDGRVEQVLMFLEDRTELCELREEVAQSERLANVGLTAAGLAHTIKNILGGMEGAMYTVDTGLEGGDDARVRSGWEMVGNYIAQVNALVLNLLDYTRPTRPDRQLFSTLELLEEVVALFESKADLVGVTLHCQVPGDVPALRADRPVIHACLANLVTNALDACMWDPDETKPSEVAVTAGSLEDGGVWFEVRDNGVGISEENQSRILKRSFTTKGIRGTGLGLLLTRKAIEQHGGEITFGSEPGSGSWFRIELPGEG